MFASECTNLSFRFAAIQRSRVVPDARLRRWWSAETIQRDDFNDNYITGVENFTECRSNFTFDVAAVNLFASSRH
jgi:hypothetical protein